MEKTRKLLVARKPDEVDVALERGLYLAAGVDVVHVGVEDDLQEHLRLVGTAAARLVKPAEAADVKRVNYSAHQADRIIGGDVLVDSFRKKNRLIW